MSSTSPPKRALWWRSTAECTELVLVSTRVRDEQLGRTGYRIVRIPAELVMANPGAALALVRSALAAAAVTSPRGC